MVICGGIFRKFKLKRVNREQTLIGTAWIEPQCVQKPKKDEILRSKILAGSHLASALLTSSANFGFLLDLCKVYKSQH